MRRSLGAALVLGLIVLAAPAQATTYPQRLVLPTSEGSRLQNEELLRLSGATIERLRLSKVPGLVRNDEVVRVAVDGAGTPQSVLLDQRLRLAGTGDYAIFERGPARTTASLDGQQPPVAQFGAVVWEGFSPGGRDLAARLTLDPTLEAARLPMTVGLSFKGANGRVQDLRPGGLVPGPGTVAITLTNASSQAIVLPVADDVPAADLAAALDRARASVAGARLPAAGSGLPVSVPASGLARTDGQALVPLRVTGTIGTTGTVTGAGTTPTTTGATITGTLSAATTVSVAVSGAGPLSLGLNVVPVLDPRDLVPPGYAKSWAAWARTKPDLAARKQAAALLVQVAATGARAASYSPYLGADLPGTGTTSFRWTIAPAPAVRRVAAPLRPRPVALSLAGVGVLLVMGGGVTVWRRL